MGNRVIWQSSPKEAWRLLSRSPDLVLPSGSAATLHGSSGNRRLFCLESGGARSWCEPLQGEKLFFPGLSYLGPLWALRTRGGGPRVMGAPAWYPESWASTRLVSWVGTAWSWTDSTLMLIPSFLLFCYQSLIQVFYYWSHVISHWTEHFPLMFKLWRNSPQLECRSLQSKLII